MSGFKYINNRRVLYNEIIEPVQPVEVIEGLVNSTYFPIHADIYNACISYTEFMKDKYQFKSEPEDYSLNQPKISSIKTTEGIAALSLLNLAHIFHKTIIIYDKNNNGRLLQSQSPDYSEKIYLYSEIPGKFDLLIPFPLRKFKCFPLYNLIIDYKGPVFTVENKDSFADLFLNETSIQKRTEFAQELQSRGLNLLDPLAAEWLTAFNEQASAFNSYDCKNLSDDLTVIQPNKPFTMLGSYKGHITQDYYWTFHCGKNTTMEVFFTDGAEQFKALDFPLDLDLDLNVVRFYIEDWVFYREVNGQRETIKTLNHENGYSKQPFGHLLCKGKGSYFALVDQQMY
jgi:hypothetical protein